MILWFVAYFQDGRKYHFDLKLVKIKVRFFSMSSVQVKKVILMHVQG